jgi:hypothetical protein
MKAMWHVLAGVSGAILGLAAGLGTALAAPSVPAALDDWRGWALHGSESALCARIGESATCAWPGELRLDVAADGLTFSQTWTLQAEQRVPLPGNGSARPLDVRANGIAVPLAMRSGVPEVVLSAGDHRIEGRIAWSRRPATLPLPASIALVSLRVDGVPVATPERNEDDALVLGAAGGGESDALQIETYRLLADGVPQVLATRLVMSVSGKAREQVLGAVLPAGFVPVLLEGEIPARVDPDGTLRVQLRPGSWSVVLIARSLAPATEFRAAQVTDAALSPLPAQEIWQFRADPLFRLAQLDGVPGVDPDQVGIPDWNAVFDSGDSGVWQALFADSASLPAYVFDRDAVAVLDVRLRGLPEQRPSRLRLERELWLNFDGEGYLARDTISGELGGALRLDMRAPWALESATAGGSHNLLVTQGADATESGVELRDPAVSLQTGARAARDGDLPANGWTQPFDQASAVLHLPPGYRLLGATGVDRAHDSWWERWSLLDIFMLSLFALMAWRLGGVPFAAALVGWFLLAWHEPLAPRISVLVAIGLTLLLRHLPAGRLARVTGWIRNGVLVLAAVLVLPFAADQLRMALHPQLEHDDPEPYSRVVADLDYSSTPVQVQMEVPQAAPPPPPPQDSKNASLDRIEVTGTRIKRVDISNFSYPADTIAQAGSARPGWQWQDHRLEWNGPLLTDEAMGLVISPPWLTRIWRVIAVLLIAFVVLQLVRERRRTAPPAARRGRASAVPALLLAASLAGSLAPPAQAQVDAMPTPELLGELRDRLLARTESCVPDCAGLGAATAIASDAGLLLQLDAHAQADTAWPLPRPDAALTLLAASIDGQPSAVYRNSEGQWILLARGVHRVELRYAANGERWRVAFPLPPAALDLQADGFEIAGVDEGRLIGDTLELVPPRRSETSLAPGQDSAPSESVPPFVRVTRNIVFDQQWTTYTRIERIAPARSGLTLPVALLQGEQLLGASPEGSLPPVRDAVATVSLPAGVDEIAWTSRITPSAQLRLVAGSGRGYAEEWLVSVAPLLHAEMRGIPESGQATPSGVRRFLPLPGEALDIVVTRPVAVAGASVAIESATLDVTPGEHARDSTLALSLRATRAGQHTLTLPVEAELLGLSIDGEQQPLIMDAGRVSVPLRTEPQTIELRWREPVGIAARLRTPEVGLGASTSNITIEMALPPDRWLLLTTGPTVGPAVLFWSSLVVMVLVAFVLTRVGGTPLRLHDWLLLGLGFSALSWWPALIVAAWLLLIGWRGRQAALVERRGFALVQVFIGLFTLLALLCLVLAIPYGLLSQPDMHVVGNNSYGGMLRWFADRSADGALPVATAITLPLWCYKLAILLWSLWLAGALIRWLRWTWTSLNAGGLWPPRKPTVDVPPPAAP